MEGGGAADGFCGTFAFAKFVSSRQQIKICQGGGVWNVAPFLSAEFANKRVRSRIVAACHKPLPKPRLPRPARTSAN